VGINEEEKELLDLVRKVVARELRAGTPIPKDDEDLVKSETIDSMGWVGVLTGLEEATGIRNFGSTWPDGKPQSMASLAEMLRVALSKQALGPKAALSQRGGNTDVGTTSITGWGYALGTQRLEAAQIEADCGLPAGTIRERAGIRSVCRADDSEDKVALGKRAADAALEAANLDAGDLDLLVCTSTTFLELPSLAAALHSRLLLGETCSVLDVGGACIGLVNALAAAKAFLLSGNRRAALVVASEVNSRRLASSNVPGEFRGLFGDAACAFMLQASGTIQGDATAFRLGDFVSGCSGSMASSLRLSVQHNGGLGVIFNGEALAKGAVMTLNEVIAKLEDISGVARSDVERFAFHEPNPRLAAILAQRAGVPIEKFTLTAETSGNLGSVTCGVNLCTALTRLREGGQGKDRHVIFVAAVGPGVLWGGTYITSGG
jgi:3-oxoacyl-[acyl-carrier-protein] synthase III